MQSSIRSETPRLVTISANPSSTSIPPLNHGVQIDREVVVRRQPGRRASFSPSSPTSSTFKHVRAQSQEPRRGSINRWDSSGRSMKRQSRPNVGQVQMENVDRVILDTNRESMKALAEFLMTKEPPPTNWISMLSDDEKSLREMKRFKVFGSLKKKKKNKAPKTPKLLKLPDSAVAASTLKGCRHIAISIPLEHDYPEHLKMVSVEPTKRPKSAPRLHGSDKGTVTVLKPVVELRESNSFSPPMTNGGNSAESGKKRARSVSTPPIDILGVEATRTLEKYYRQLHQQQRTAAEGRRPETSHGRIPIVESSIAASKVHPRHSVGTVYSTLVMSTPGHSREVSTTTTAPVVIPITGLRLDLPPRGSSKSTIPISIEHELKIESARVAAFELEKKIQLEMSSSPSLKSDSSQAQTISFGMATAESARAYSSPGIQYFSRSTTPLVSAAPTKKLPDLPRGADGQIVRPSTAPLSKSNSANSHKSATRSASFKDCTAESLDAAQQSRQERVKARKLRDLAAIRATLDDGNTPAIPPLSLMPKTTRASKHRTSDSVNKKNLNRMSQIMLVANLPPFTGSVLPSDLPSPQTSRQLLNKQPSSASSCVRIPTPPRSLHEVDFGSDSDTIPSSRPRTSRRTSRTASSNSPPRAIDARRQERRTKRNTTLHEKELDARLSKIEKDNQMLLITLRNIASSFGQLSKMLPFETEEVGMEPLMRELSGGSQGRQRVEIR